MINGTICHMQVFHYTEGWVLIDIPLKGLTPIKNRYELTMINSEILGPASHGVSRDTRTLGVGVSFVGFSTAENKISSGKVLTYRDRKKRKGASSLHVMLRRLGIMRRLRRKIKHQLWFTNS